MNLNTKFELGETVTSILDNELRLHIVKITIYLDGGYQYETTRIHEGQFIVNDFFERELEGI